MSNSPTVSVVMPVHNAERYLRPAIESVLNQTLFDWELLIIDDGSTDGTLDLLQKYARKDRRIRLTSREWRGIAPTRQELLALSSGEFYAMMDADDESEPQRLEQQVAYLIDHPECICVTCRVLVTDPDGSPIRVINHEVSHEEIDAANLTGSSFFHNGAYMIRRTALLACGGIRDFPLAYDLDLFLRLAEHGKIACLPTVLYKYRQHLSNVTRRWKDLNESVSRAVRDAYERRGVSPAACPQRALPGSPESPLDQQRKWAWWALAAGYRTTARKHALAVLRQTPLSRDSWRLLACAVRGH